MCQSQLKSVGTLRSPGPPSTAGPSSGARGVKRNVEELAEAGQVRGSVADGPQELEDCLVDAAVESQRKVVEVKKAVQKAASFPAAVVAPYVHATGAVVGPLVTNSKKPRKPDVAPPLPDSVLVLMGPGARWATDAARFRLCHDWARAHILLVDRVNERLCTPEALKCRLQGLRICDNQFLETDGRKGSCLCFKPALKQHLYLHLSDEFVLRYPDHSNILLECNSSPDARIRVFRSAAPEAPAHPFLTFTVQDRDKADSSKSTLNLDELLQKVGILYQAEETE